MTTGSGKTWFERGSALVGRVARKAAGGGCIYTRGGSTVYIEATFGRPDFSIEDSSGVRIEHTDRDFIVPAADLILNGALITPQRGDRVTVLEEDKTFEVLAPGGDQPYRLCDSQGKLIRIHGKRME